MARWVCLGCATAYAVALFGCPRCHGTEFAEDGSEEAEMAKITVHGGPSNADPNTPDSEEEVPEREYVPGEPLPEVPASAYAEDAVPLDPAPEQDETPPPKAKPARKPRGRKAADSTGSTGLQVTAEAEVTRDGERAS